MADIETFGIKLWMGTGAEPEAYIQVAGITSFPQLFNFTRSTIDTSEISDEVKTFLGGQADPGNVTFGLKFDPNENTHSDAQGLIHRAKTRGRTNWVLEIPGAGSDGATYMYFSGVLIDLSVTGEMDDIVRGNATIKMSGLPEFMSDEPNKVAA